MVLTRHVTQKRRQLTSSLFTIIVSVLLILPAHAEQTSAEQTLPLEQIRLFAEVYSKIKQLYVDEVSDEKLLNDAIDGMINGLDPHSAYVRGDSYQSLKEGTRGKFGGVGVEIVEDKQGLRIVTPIDDSPASDVDLRAGDIIIKVDDTFTRNMSLQQAVDIMRGEPGSELTLTVLRDGEDMPLEKTLTREIIQARTVTGEWLLPGFAYMRISQFQSGTAASLRDQLLDMQENTESPMRGLLLDLRNNPGGLLNSAVGVSDVFLDKGTIVSTRGRSSGNQSKFSASAKDYIDAVPIVVLINQGSASAAEIVAGALQENQRALIVGKPSFGKGSVQTIVNLSDNKALKITTALYYTPSGVSIQARGIQPDITVEQRELKARNDNRIDYNEASLNKHLSVDDAENESPKTKVDAKIADRLERDFQLKEALNILQGIALYRH